MELSGRVVTLLILAGMSLGIFLDQPQRKKRKKKASPPPAPTPGQKIAKLIEQYVDGQIGP